MPRSIFYMNELPRLGTGKIDYVVCVNVWKKTEKTGLKRKPLSADVETMRERIN